MGYTLIKAFERGIDTRKLLDTIEPGALLDARDCHVTLGGEIEKRAAFSIVATLPAGTIGLYVTEGRVLNTWGDAATAPAGMPPNSVYHSIPHPDGFALTHIMSVEEFNGGMYVIAQYAGGSPLHWWNDALIREKPIPPGDDGSGGSTTPPPTGPANKPQTNFYLQLTGTGTTPPPDVYVQWVYLVAPASTYNFGVDAFMLIPQDGVSSGFPFCNTQFVAAATNEAQVTSLIAGLINTTVTVPKVYASNSGINLSPVFVDDANTTYNGWKIEISLSNCRVWPSGSESLSGGVAPPPGPPPPSPAPSGPLPPINKGTFAIAHNEHMWAVQDAYPNAYLNRSAARKPDEWEDQLQGAGQINMTMITPRRPKLISLSEYRTDLAIFGTRHVIIYHMDEDALKSFKRQVLHNTGTFAPHSVTSFGEGEVMYLDISGIRSLRARDSSDAAFAADIGNMIDELVKAKIAIMTDEQKYHRVWGLVEPRSGRLWMALFDRIYVLSYYPSSRIAAWTWYDATTAPVYMANTSDDSVYWRSGDNVICYGGEAGTVYDATEALSRVPYIDGGKPATHKNWSGLDVAMYGAWTVRASFDPTVPAALDLIANLTKSTYAQQKIAMNGESPGVSLQFTSTFVGPAKLGNATVHYTESTAD
jgi:hypothetical protein